MEYKTNLTIHDWYTLEKIFVLIHDTPAEDIIPVLLKNIKEVIPYIHSHICIPSFPGSNTEKSHSRQYQHYSPDIPDKMLKSYMCQYKEIDFINWYVHDIEGRKNIFRESDIISNEVRDKSKFAIEWLFPLGIYYGCGMIVEKGQTEFVQIFFYRGMDDGDFTDRELEILGLVREHLSIKLCNSESPDLQSALNDNTSDSKMKLLTKREKEIVDLISSGILRSNLSGILYVSENTLYKHLANIYRKLSINSFEQLLWLLNKDGQDI